MEQLTELKNAIVERFKLNSYVGELERKMEIYAEKSIFEKYKGTIILRSGLQYELFAVKAHSKSWAGDITPKNVDLTLIYTIISKIDSNQKKALLNAKNYYSNNKYMGHYEGKKKLWIQECYEVEPELVMNDEINLDTGNTK
jgi:hypothetical protein